MNSFCRTCLIQLSKDDTDIRKHHIFNAKYFPTFISRVTLMPIDANDEFSKYLCDICYNKVNDFHNFVEQSAASMEKMIEMLAIGQKEQITEESAEDSEKQQHEKEKRKKAEDELVAIQVKVMNSNKFESNADAEQSVNGTKWNRYSKAGIIEGRNQESKHEALIAFVAKYCKEVRASSISFNNNY